MRRSRYLRLDQQARKADRVARAVGLRFIHRATAPSLMRGTDPREGYMVDMTGARLDFALLSPEPPPVRLEQFVTYPFSAIYTEPT